jgi:glycosyltransferase involved in cell wall biosynthesis
MTPSTAPTSVLLVTPGWTRDGGVATHVRVSASALAAHGLEVHVAAALIDSDEDEPGVNVLHAPDLFNARVPIERRIAFPVTPEVIHLHQVEDPELVSALRRVAPVVTSAHAYIACTSGVYYFRPGEQCTRGHGPGCVPNLALRGCAHTRYPKTLPAKYLNATRARAALERADLAVCYSSAVDRHLAANGISHRTIVPLFPTLTPRQGSGHEHRRRVVYAGRMVRPKGVGVLMRAASEVDAEFVLCGDGRELQPMRELARRLGLERRVRFTGWLGPDALATELAEASVVAVPSLWPEPFGLVGIEAFASGRPAVASATGGIGDWLDDGVSGLSVPPADAGALARALADLLDDPERQRSMGLAGRETVAQRFSPERHVARLLEGYRTARSRWQSAPTRV